jgi:hypothetical protein
MVRLHIIFCQKYTSYSYIIYKGKVRKERNKERKGVFSGNSKFFTIAELCELAVKYLGNVTS